jgi:hypothetical protein
VGRRTGLVLVGLGVFVLALAFLSRFYMYDRIAVVPIDYERVLVSEGSDATIFDIGSQSEVTTDLVATRNVVGEVKASESAQDSTGDDLAVWETLVYTRKAGAPVGGDNPPLSATHDRVAFDRHSAVVADCCGNYLTTEADLVTGSEQRDTQTPIEGQYFKLPFDAQKKTYQFWDGSLKKATDMVYKATESIEGLTVYRYEQVIEPTNVGQFSAPASFFGIDQEGDVELDEIYANTRTLWVEPETGVIIRGQEDQDVVAEYQGQQVGTLTSVLIGYNDTTVKANIDEYEPLASQLKLIRVWVPLLGGIVGALLIVIGVVLAVRNRTAGRRRSA